MIPDQIWLWPVLAGFSAYLAVGGWLVSNDVARNIGGAMLLAYALMQIKKMGWPGLEGHFVSMAIWIACASAIASIALIVRENYGNSLIYATSALLLMLCGTCYLWARIVGQLSGIGVSHSIVSDSLAFMVMLLAGRGLGRELWSQFGRNILAGNIG